MATVFSFSDLSVQESLMGSSVGLTPYQESFAVDPNEILRKDHARFSDAVDYVTSHSVDYVTSQSDDFASQQRHNDSADFVQKFEPDFVKEENTFSENEEVDEKPVFDHLQHFQLQQQQQQQHDNEQMFKTFTNNSTDMYLNFIGNHNNNNNNNSGTQNNNNNNNGIHNNNNNSNRNRSNNQIIHSANSRLLNCSGMVHLDPTRQQGLPRFEPQETLNLDPTRQQSFLPRFEPEETPSPGSPSNHFGRRQRDLHLNVKLVNIFVDYKSTFALFQRPSDNF